MLSLLSFSRNLFLFLSVLFISITIMNFKRGLLIFLFLTPLVPMSISLYLGESVPLNLFVKEMGCFVYLIPHVYSFPSSQYDDRKACHYVYLQLPSQIQRHITLIEKDFTARELKWIIGQFTFFIGGRMHSCIDALSMKVPTMATAYSHKFKGIMDTIGVGYLVCDLRKMTEEEIVQKVINGYKEKDEIRQDLEFIIPSTEEKALKCNEFI